MFIEWDIISVGWPTSRVKEISVQYRISIAIEISREWDIPPHMKGPLAAKGQQNVNRLMTYNCKGVKYSICDEILQGRGLLAFFR